MTIECVLIAKKKAIAVLATDAMLFQCFNNSMAEATVPFKTP